MAGWLGVFLVGILWGCVAFVISVLPTAGDEHPEDAGFPIGSILIYSFLTRAPEAALVGRAQRSMRRGLGAALGLMWVVGVLLMVVGWAT